MCHARRRPQRLAEKLRQVRNNLGLSQAELHKRLGIEEDIPYTRISDYELDKNESRSTRVVTWQDSTKFL